MIRPEPELDAGSEMRDLRLVPMAVAAWLATWLGTSGERPGLLVGAALAAGIAATAGVRRSLWIGSVALTLAGCLVISAVHHQQMTNNRVSELAFQEAIVSTALVIKSDPHVQPASGPKPAFLTLRAVVVKVTGRGETWQLQTPVLVTVSGPEVGAWRARLVGSTVEASGRLQTPTTGSDFAAVVRIRGPSRVVQPPSPGLRLVEKVRAGLRRAVSARRVEQRALVPALVLGDTSAMTEDITADFQDTGLTHLTAVSGANLTLLLAFMLLLARWAGVRGWWLRAVGLFGVFVFVALCRTEPSVLRAAAMGLVALAALGAGTTRKGVRNLAVAMLILLVFDPWLSRSIGFALSVLASGGIVWWARRWADVLHRWMPRILAESVSVPLAAHLATLPVVAAISGKVSVVGVLTNAVAGPVVGPATVLGFAAAGLSLISAWLAAAVGFGAAWSAQAILWTAQLGAQFPGAAWTWPASPAALTILAVAALLLAQLMPHILSRRWAAAFVATIMIIGFVRAPAQPGWPPRDWVLVACDVGQGDGLVLRLADRQAVVVDVGPDPSMMNRCLDQLGIRGIPLLVLTHFHADHVEGLSGALDGRPVGQIMVSPLASPQGEAEQVLQLAQQRGIAVRVPALGEVVQIGDVLGQVLGPIRGAPGNVLAQADGESAAENDMSLVIMVTIKNVRILLTGDVEPPGQQTILRSGADLSADVLKVSHHGSARQDEGFIAATRARVAIASAGQHNDYGHPAPRTVRLVESLGMTLLRTDTEGSVAVISNNGQIGAVTQRHG